MSKQVKEMQMADLKHQLQDVRDMVFLAISGVSSQSDNEMRLTLLKKKIQMQVVKNTLARRVLKDLGMEFDPTNWEGPTTVAWGAGSLAELSRELETVIKKNPKIKPKSAVVEGQEVSFQNALEMPTREEAIGQVLGLVIGPAAQIAAQIIGPAGQIAGQIKSIADKAEG